MYPWPLTSHVVKRQHVESKAAVVFIDATTLGIMFRFELGLFSCKDFFMRRKRNYRTWTGDSAGLVAFYWHCN